MKQLLIILAIIIAGGVLLTENQENNIVIPNNSLRLRIVPHSNAPEDREVKFLIRDLLEKTLPRLLGKARTLDNAKEVIEENLDYIETKVSEVLKPLNQTFTISHGRNYFPTKVFKGVIYNSGEYDSLVITIGDGKGDNWWCVLFPPLCSLERKENIDEVEYQFFVSRIINKFK